MIYRSIFSFNLGALSRTWLPTSVRNLSTSWQTIGTGLRFKSLSLSLVFLPRQLLGIGQSNFVIVETKLPIEKWANPNEFPASQREFQKPTYTTKTFSFQLRVRSSSAEQSSITELLHFPNLPLAYPRCRDEVRLSWSLAIAVVSACIREFVQQKLQIAYCFTLISFWPLNKTWIALRPRHVRERAKTLSDLTNNSARVACYSAEIRFTVIFFR